jgi:hypothetical protein
VTVTIAGRRYTLAVLAPKTIKAGQTATIHLHLIKTAVTRLAGHTLTIRLTLTITHQGKKTCHAVKTTIKGTKKPAKYRG